MKVSLNWAQSFSKTDLKSLPVEELVALATERLGGIEGYEELTDRYKNIYIARIASYVKHPNADKLRICKIDDGGKAKGVERDENGLVQVVCGAPELEEGWIVAWLAPGATVPASYQSDPFTLAAKELRGEISYGMLGTPAELDVSKDDSGLLVLTQQQLDEKLLTVGSTLSQLLALDDLILEIENKMFTHRPDCFGILGVARELAGIQHKKFTSPDWYLNKPTFENADRLESTLFNETPELAPRAMIVPLDGITVAPSPLWMQSYLNRVGIRPINNIVDITNYIMYLTAQPMHAFDYDKIAARSEGGATIGPRMAREGEKITLLGNKKVTLTAGDIVLATDKQAVDIAGVMGGAETEVDENTKSVLLTCCAFDMYTVRKMTMRHGIFTDAATRNTKGQPPAQVDRILAYAMKLMGEYAGAKQAGEVHDNYESPVEPGYIEVTTKFINERLGSKLNTDEIIALLTNVEFEAHEASGPISVTAPFWRTDIEIAEDIVEEIGRLNGFNQLPIALPRRSIAPVSPEPMRVLKSDLRTAFSRSGANEVLTYSFVHGDLLKKAGQDVAQAFAIRNALSPDLQYYRLSLLPSLLDKVHANIKAGYDEFTLFEIGKTHNKILIDEETELPDEPNYLEAVYTSAKPKPGAAYFTMLKTVDAVLGGLGIQYKLVPSEEDATLQLLKPFDQKRSAYIYNATESGGMIGFIGELRGSVIKGFKLPEYTAAAVFALDGPSFEAENRAVGGAYKPLSRYQSSKQDLTLKVAESVSFAELRALIEEELEKTQYDTLLTPLGVYQKEGEVTKNVTFRITLSHFERTLTTSEVSQLVEGIALRAHEVLGAEQV